MKKLWLSILLFVSPLLAQNGQFTGVFGNLPPSVPLVGLQHAWIFINGATPIRDLVGGPSFNFGGAVQGVPNPGVNYGSTSYIEPAATNYYSTPGIQYNLSTAATSGYSQPNNTNLTFGDGNPHTLILFYAPNFYGMFPSGTGFAGGNVILKNAEYEIAWGSSNGGSIALKYGVGLAGTINVPSYLPVTAKFSAVFGPNVNSPYGFYMVRITYDGSTSLCVGINDAAATCASGVTLTQQAAPLTVNFPNVLEAMFAYNSVLLSSKDSGASCGGPFSATPCVIDALYNGGRQNPWNWYRPANPAYANTLQIDGTNLVGEADWGSTYSTFQSVGLGSGTYTSGGSISGSAGQTCNLASFNGNNVGGTATVALTGTNVIAGGTALTITAAGVNSSAAATSATLSNGTATCSGTATVSTTLVNSTPNYIVPNALATATVSTNAPSLSFDLVVLHGTAGQSAQYANVGVWKAAYSGGCPSAWASYSFYGFASTQGAGGVVGGTPQPTIALPGDGLTYCIRFNVSSQVAWGGNDVTPYAGMAAAVVNTVSVYGPYSLTGIIPSHSNTLLLINDSIGEGFGANYIWTDGVFARLKTNNGGNIGDVVIDGVGGGALYHDIGCNPGAGGGASTACTTTAWAAGSVSNQNAQTPAAYANTLKTRMGGICPKYLFMQRGTNDYGRGIWFAADAETAMGYFWTQWFSICPATINYQMSAIYRSTVTANAKGDALVAYNLAGTHLTPNWQEDLAAVCTSGVNCTNIDVSGTNGTVKGQAGNTNGFPQPTASGISLLAGGTGYTNTTGNATTASCAGSGATINTVQSGGVITTMTLNANGTGYTLPCTLTLTGGGGNATATVLAVSATGAIQAYYSCASIIGEGLPGNFAFGSGGGDGLHPATCGYRMYFGALFKNALGWITSF